MLGVILTCFILQSVVFIGLFTLYNSIYISHKNIGNIILKCSIIHLVYPNLCVY